MHHVHARHAVACAIRYYFLFLTNCHSPIVYTHITISRLSYWVKVRFYEESKLRNYKLNVRNRIEALEELKAGKTAADVCAAWNISVTTLYTWKKIYEGQSIAGMEKLEQLMRENHGLQLRIKAMELDVKILQEALHLQELAPDQKRTLINVLRNKFDVSLARVSRLLSISRSFYTYQTLHIVLTGI